MKSDEIELETWCIKPAEYFNIIQLSPKSIYWESFIYWKIVLFQNVGQLWRPGKTRPRVAESKNDESWTRVFLNSRWLSSARPNENEDEFIAWQTCNRARIARVNKHGERLNDYSVQGKSCCVAACLLLMFMRNTSSCFSLFPWLPPQRLRRHPWGREFELSATLVWPRL